MFGVEYLLALSKIAFNVAFAIVTAIPFYFAWNCVAPVYLVKWLPALYINLPYWHIVSMFLVLTFLGEQIHKITPRLISVSQSNS